MKLQVLSVAAGLLAQGLIGLAPSPGAAEPVKPGISETANTAVQQMGKTLSAVDFSFQARTIRVYLDPDGQPLHIFHTMKVAAHRPDRLAVHVTGDDGSRELIYDGRTLAVADPSEKKYAKVPAPNTIQATMEVLMGRLHIDFPLADLLTPAPNKAFLSGVTSGREIGTVTIDGKPYRHLFFTQAGGVELETWIEKSEQALPLRLIVTYRLLPGQPNFIAEFSDWNFSARPEADFVFRPPAGAQQVDMKPTGEGK